MYNVIYTFKIFGLLRYELEHSSKFTCGYIHHRFFFIKCHKCQALKYIGNFMRTHLVPRICHRQPNSNTFEYNIMIIMNDTKNGGRKTHFPKYVTLCKGKFTKFFFSLSSRQILNSLYFIVSSHIPHLQCLYIPACYIPCVKDS